MKYIKYIKNIIPIIIALVFITNSAFSVFAITASRDISLLAGQTAVIRFEFPDSMMVRGTVTVTDNSIFSDFQCLPGGDARGTYEVASGKFMLYNSSVEFTELVITVDIAADAAIGSSAVITIEYESSPDGKLPAEPKYDYSTVNITVDDIINHDTLKYAIADGESLLQEDYTIDSYAALTEALQTGVNALESTDPAVINAAQDEIFSAMENLVLADKKYTAAKEMRLVREKMEQLTEKIGKAVDNQDTSMAKAYLKNLADYQSRFENASDKVIQSKDKTVWMVLFFVALAGLIAAGYGVFTVYRKGKNGEYDITPIVDYDIDEDGVN